ncbi:hypothetical protein KIPB_002018 [Kipferlia bialata]|uniref:Misato Segment II tubulin-like domain-containing protein n=1 Tax=Kipferlia bialata TaxID=797122 RepID=A0A391NUR0_9EUKA|nr:hypothetical protein KIPB_002018 [Kipferlia bialata]|eukprot:g2018.t1
MREIITVQLGNAANHVGSHFWNMQYAEFLSGSVNYHFDHDTVFHSAETGGRAMLYPRVREEWYIPMHVHASIW